MTDLNLGWRLGVVELSKQLGADGQHDQLRATLDLGVVGSAGRNLNVQRQHPIALSRRIFF